MSDFLTRLAARQLGQIETIEPRVRPLYDHADTAPHFPAEIEETRVLRTAQTDAAATTTLPGVREQFPRPYRNESTQDSAVPRLRQAGAAQAPQPPVAEESTRMERRQPAQTERAVSTAVRSVPDQALKPAPAAPVSDRELPRLSTPMSAPQLPPVPAIANRTGEPVAVQRSESATAPSPQRDRGPRAPAPLIVQEVRVESLPKLLTEAPVRVSIGRIEVTAVPEAQAPRRVPAARKPRVSLDEYLGRRQGSSGRER